MTSKHDLNDPEMRAAQYKDSRNLAARANLHVKYGRGDWSPWLADAAGLNEGASVLDIGCGAGWFWNAAADRLPAGLTVTLADLSEGMIGEAMDRVVGLKPGWQVEGLVADVGKLPFADETFDNILAFHMLYHATDPAAGIAEIARVLRPGGTALITTNGHENIRALYMIGHRMLGGPDHEPVADLFGLENAPALLAPHFCKVELLDYPDVLRCTDALDICATLCSFPPGSQASVEQLEALEAFVTAQLADNGGVFVTQKSTGAFRCVKPGG